MKNVLIIAALFAMPFATANAGVEPDSLPVTSSGTDPAPTTAPATDQLFLDNPELFQNRLYFHVYDHNDNEVLSREHSTDSLHQDAELLAVLKRSKLLVKTDNHYFFYLND
jgi:hypothetical protein